MAAKKKKSNLLSYAERELDIIGLKAKGDKMDVAMRKNILHMVEEFSKDGHSGMSAPYAVSILTKLLSWQPLSDIDCKDDTWNDVSGVSDESEPIWQNTRVSSLFKDSEDIYIMNGYIFDEDSCSWSNYCSFKYFLRPIITMEDLKTKHVPYKLRRFIRVYELTKKYLFRFIRELGFYTL